MRLCVSHAIPDGQKKFVRLWLPDQTPETVKQGLCDLKDESEYESLASEGFARTYIDWLYGVNLTRFATLKTGKLLRVGRVIVPIVKAIYDRDMEIKNFNPEKYYVMSSQKQTASLSTLPQSRGLQRTSMKNASGSVLNTTRQRLSSPRQKRKRTRFSRRSSSLFQSSRVISEKSTKCQWTNRSR